MTLSAGFRLGPYEVLAPLGAGGMGEVYRAKDPRLGREVAIKVLPASLSQDADRLRRFEQEARAAGLLNHPNITAVYDIGQHEGAPYVVEELLEGETLRSTLAGGRLSPRKATDYALQVAHGLAAAHEKGIVHRDLKPENLFVTRDGRVKILDFGLAKLIQPEIEGSQQTNLPTASAGTEPGVVLGTLGYMSPEQVRGRAADHRSDLFSFGAILYEMLSGRRAFQGDSAADTMSAILKEDPPDLSVTNQNVSPGLERIVRHCLEKNPEQRFHSAHDLAFDLEALSGRSGPAAAPAAGRGVRARRPILAGAALLVAAGVLAAAFWIGRGTGHSKAETSPVFRRLTFRRGLILGARFAPDGKTIVYTASFDGKPGELFLARADGGEPKSLGISNSRVLGVSRSGEIALNLRKEPSLRWYTKGTLVQMPLLGGAPRPILENVIDADWSPDGRDLAIVLEAEGKTRLEFPAGTKLDESSVSLGSPRVSPDGRSVAYVRSGRDSDAIVLADRSGSKRTLVEKGIGILDLAWHPSGKEIWYDESGEAAGTVLSAVTLAGERRTILASPDTLGLCDIAADGTALIERRTLKASLLFRGPHDAQERDLSWLDWSVAGALSPDGETLAFIEIGDSSGSKGAVYLRKTDGSPPVRLGGGDTANLSPDGKSVLAVFDGKLMLYPTGTGQPRQISTGDVKPFWAAFLPDSRTIRILGLQPGHDRRNWILDSAGGAPRPFTPEGAQGNSVASPDGRSVAVYFDKEGHIYLCPLEGGERRVVPGTERGERAFQWSDDGRFLYVLDPDGPLPRRVFKVEIATGARQLWKELAPADSAGLYAIFNVVITRDGRSYAYTASRASSSDLYLVEGLK